MLILKQTKTEIERRRKHTFGSVILRVILLLVMFARGLPERRHRAAHDVQLVAEEREGVHHLQVLVCVAVIEAKTLPGGGSEAGRAGCSSGLP